jgi:hypothetical protein
MWQSWRARRAATRPIERRTWSSERRARASPRPAPAVASCSASTSRKRSRSAAPTSATGTAAPRAESAVPKFAFTHGLGSHSRSNERTIPPRGQPPRGGCVSGVRVGRGVLAGCGGGSARSRVRVHAWCGSPTPFRGGCDRHRSMLSARTPREHDGGGAVARFDDCDRVARFSRFAPPLIAPAVKPPPTPKPPPSPASVAAAASPCA